MITTLTYEQVDGMSTLVQTKIYSDGTVKQFTIDPNTLMPMDSIDISEESTREEMIANIVKKF